MSELAINAEHIVKTFRAGPRATSLKERFLGRGASKRAHTFTALNDINVQIPRGQTVALIGHNGSGKSTLLKVLSGIIRPSSGTVAVNGRVASLLELGAGFNGELSGRENIYLNASLLGLSRRETDQLYDSIVDFSELEEFIDEPVKHYSSGMYVRLGFAVAVHIDPDILLVDEVLAVGDEAFQRKCIDKIAEFQHEGRTILVVTHALSVVEDICDRGIVLDHGELVFDGDPEYATGTLRMLLGTTPREHDDAADSGDPTEAPPEPVSVLDATVHTDSGSPSANVLHGGQSATVRIKMLVRPHGVGRCSRVTVVAMGLGDIPVLAFRHEGGPDGLPAEGGVWTVDFDIPELPRLVGAFVFAVQVEDDDGTVLTAYRSPRGFRVVTTETQLSLVAASYTSSSRTEREALVTGS